MDLFDGQAGNATKGPREVTRTVRGRSQQLVRNAELYHRSFDKSSAPSTPRTGVAVVTCIDARLNIYGMLGLAEGDAHVIRNAGGVITDDVMRSLVFGQEMVGTSEIMLIMHDECCMRTITDDEFAGRVEARAGVRPDWPAVGFTEPEEELRRAVDALRHDPFLMNSTQIRAFVYNERWGSLRELERDGASPLSRRPAGPA